MDKLINEILDLRDLIKEKEAQLDEMVKQDIAFMEDEGLSKYAVNEHLVLTSVTRKGSIKVAKGLDDDRVNQLIDQGYLERGKSSTYVKKELKRVSEASDSQE